MKAKLHLAQILSICAGYLLAALFLFADATLEIAVLSVITVAIGATAIRHQALRDLGTLCLGGVVWSGLLAFLAIAVAWEAPVLRLRAGLTGGLALAVTGLFIWGVLRQQRDNPDAPDLLRARFPRAWIREKNGVQIVIQAPQRVVACEKFVIEVSLQNTFDAERSVTLGLTEFGHREETALTTATVPTIDLSPLEVGILRIPASARGRGSSRLEIVTRLEVSGSSGLRLRKRTAPEFHNRTTEGDVAIGLAVGLIQLHGGSVLRIFVQPASLDQAELPTVGEAQWETLWHPDARLDVLPKITKR